MTTGVCESVLNLKKKKTDQKILNTCKTNVVWFG